MKKLIVCLAVLLSSSAMAKPPCNPAVTWTDGGVTFDKKCMYKLGPGWMHIANPYQTWAYSQMKPGEPYFKPGADFDDAFGKLAIASGICVWSLGQVTPGNRKEMDACIDLMQRSGVIHSDTK